MNGIDTSNVNREAIAEWVAALRSGEYQQGAGQLHFQRDGGDYYCCLGVACAVFAERVGLKPAPHYLGRAVVYRDKYLSEYGSYLPPSLAQFLFGDSSITRPEVQMIGGTQFADTLNDSELYTFTQIADLIEATYLKPEADSDADPS